MTNCATLLASRIAARRVPPNQPAQVAFGFRAGIDDLDAWRRHFIDVELVARVDATLQGMNAAGEDVDMFRETLPRWYAAVMFATVPWNSSVNGIRESCASGDLNLLRALGALIQAGKPIPVGEDDKRTLLDVLAQARELLEEGDDGLGDDARRYIHGLIVRAEMVARNIEQYGTEAVRQVAFELGGVMTMEAERLEQTAPDKAARWRSAGAMIMGGFLGRAGEAMALGAGMVGGQVINQIAGG